VSLPPGKVPNSELLADYVKKTAHLQKRAWVFTAIPLAIFVFTIVVGTQRLSSLIRQADIAEERRDRASAELKGVENRLREAKRSTAICGTAFSYVTDSSTTAQAAYKKAASQFPDVALVTIQVADKTQLPKAEEIADSLRRSGYEVPPQDAIDIRGNHISHGSYLRYFYEQDKPLAEIVLGVINRLGVNAKLYDLSDAKDVGETHPRQFELRLGLDSVPQVTGQRSSP
jgi:hypothetical protein